MAQDNLKDFTVEWVIFGLLFTCLVSFAVSFMFFNNPIGFDGGSNSILNTSAGAGQNNLYEIPTNSDGVLNITAQTNPEASFLGSRDSVATGFSATEESRNSWALAKNLISWTFTGEIGKMMLAVFGGLIGYLIFYFTFKWIRTGT